MQKQGFGKYDKGNAIITIISGAGGDDAEDFVSMLLSMYMKYVDKKVGEFLLFMNIKMTTMDIEMYLLKFITRSPLLTGEVGEEVGSYGTLRNESGVHRLVRISPFNAKKLRHTSFCLVEVLPEFGKLDEKDFLIPEYDLRIEFAKSSGPGGKM